MFHNSARFVFLWSCLIPFDTNPGLVFRTRGSGSWKPGTSPFGACRLCIHVLVSWQFCPTGIETSRIWSVTIEVEFKIKIVAASPRKVAISTEVASSSSPLHSFLSLLSLLPLLYVLLFFVLSENLAYTIPYFSPHSQNGQRALRAALHVSAKVCVHDMYSRRTF